MWGTLLSASKDLHRWGGLSLVLIGIGAALIVLTCLWPPFSDYPTAPAALGGALMGFGLCLAFARTTWEYRGVCDDPDYKVVVRLNLKGRPFRRPLVLGATLVCPECRRSEFVTYSARYEQYVSGCTVPACSHKPTKDEAVAYAAAGRDQSWGGDKLLPYLQDKVDAGLMP